MPGLLSLPDEVLKLVLSHVPLEDRLCSCCLSHSRLHAAAIAATQQLDLGQERLQPERAQSVLSWLLLHGQHVNRLDMCCPHTCFAVRQLPASLVHLRLNGGCFQLGPTADGHPGVLEGLTKLTRLELNSSPMGDGVSVDSLSSLVHLKHLSVIVELSPATLTHLQHLTHLTSRGMLVENLRQLSALTALQELDCGAAYHVKDSPSGVSGLVLPASLTKLVLATNSRKGVELALLPHVPTGLRALSITYEFYKEPQSLLSCMARLPCLTQLYVSAWRFVAWPLPGPAYSALTASSSLVSLTIAADVPAGVWPYVFRATHQLPHLTWLAFDEDWDEPDARWAFEAADLAALVRCCPGLCEIHQMCLLPGPHVSELHKLTALTKLEQPYCTDDDPVGTVEGLSAVTQLRYLNVYLGDATAPLSVASLLPLTSLTRLTSLCCAWCENDVKEHIVDTEDGSPPDVWLQLLEQCAAAEPACQPTALRSLAQQLAEQRALTAVQAEQIAGLQAQLADQQQRHEAAQQQVAAEQGARMTALEGQLQQLLQRLL